MGLESSGTKARSSSYNRSNWGLLSTTAQFVEYKAAMSGLRVEYGEPSYTSKCCSKCECLGLRNGNDFHCKFCDWQTHADFNEGQETFRREMSS